MEDGVADYYKWKERNEDRVWRRRPLVDHRLEGAWLLLLIEHYAVAQRQRNEDAFHADLHHILHPIVTLALQRELEDIIERNCFGRRRKRPTGLAERLIADWTGIHGTAHDFTISSRAARLSENLVALKYDEEPTTTEHLAYLHTNRRARQKHHRLMEDSERTIAIGDPEPGDVEDRSTL